MMTKGQQQSPIAVNISPQDGSHGVHFVTSGNTEEFHQHINENQSKNQQPSYETLYHELEQAKHNYDLLYAHWQREIAARIAAEQVINSLREQITSMAHEEALEENMASDMVVSQSKETVPLRRESSLLDKVLQLDSQQKSQKINPYPQGNKYNMPNSKMNAGDQNPTVAKDVEIDDFRERYAILAMQVKLAKEEIHQRDIAVQALQRKCKRLEEKEAQAQAELEVMISTEELSDDGSCTGSKIKEQQRYIEELENDNKDLMEQIVKQEKEMKQRAEEVTELHIQLERLQFTLKKLRNQQEGSSCDESSVREKLKELESLMKENTALQKEVEELKQQLSACQDQIQISRVNNRSLEDQLSIMTVERDLIVSLKDAKASMTDKNRKLERELNDAYISLQDLRDELSKVKEELDRRTKDSTVAALSDDEIEIIHHGSKDGEIPPSFMQCAECKALTSQIHGLEDSKQALQIEKQLLEKENNSLNQRIQTHEHNEKTLRTAHAQEIMSYETRLDQLNERVVELQCEIELLEKEKQELQDNEKDLRFAHAKEITTLEEEKCELHNSFIRLQDALDEAKNCQECKKKTTYIKELDEKLSQVSYRLKKLQESMPKVLSEKICESCPTHLNTIDKLKKEQKEYVSQSKFLEKSLEAIKSQKCSNCQTLLLKNEALEEGLSVSQKKVRELEQTIDSINTRNCADCEGHLRKISDLDKDRLEAHSRCKTLEKSISELKSKPCSKCAKHAELNQRLENENTSLLNQVEGIKQSRTNECSSCEANIQSILRLENENAHLKQRSAKMEIQAEINQKEALELIRKSLQNEVLLSQSQLKALQKDEELRSMSASEHNKPSLFRAKERELEQIQSELEIREQAISSLKERIEHLEKSLKEASQTTRDIRVQLRDSQTELDSCKVTLADRELKIKTLETTKRELELELHFNQRQLERTTEEWRNLKREHEILQKEAKELRIDAAEAKKLRVECEELSIDLDVADRRIETLERDLKDLKTVSQTEIQDQSSSLHKLAKRNNILYNELDAKTKTIAYLESVVASQKSIKSFERVEESYLNGPNILTKKEKFIKADMLMQEQQQTAGKKQYHVTAPIKSYRKLPMVMQPSKQSRNDSKNLNRSHSPYARETEPVPSHIQVDGRAENYSRGNGVGSYVVF